MCKYDKVARIVKRKYGIKVRVKLIRLKCMECHSVHRCIPNYIFPYKHYEREIINGVLEGYISSSTFGFEDYPCEKTTERWRDFFTDFVLTNQEF